MRTTSMMSLVILASTSAVVMSAPLSLLSTRKSHMLVARAYDPQDLNEAIDLIRGKNIDALSQVHFDALHEAAEAGNEHALAAIRSTAPELDQALARLRAGTPLSGLTPGQKIAAEVAADSGTPEQKDILEAAADRDAAAAAGKAPLVTTTITTTTFHNKGIESFEGQPLRSSSAAVVEHAPPQPKAGMNAPTKALLVLAGVDLAVLVAWGIGAAVESSKSHLTKDEIQSMVDYYNTWQSNPTSGSQDPRPAMYNVLVTLQQEGKVSSTQVSGWETATGYDQQQQQQQQSESGDYYSPVSKRSLVDLD